MSRYSKYMSTVFSLSLVSVVVATGLAPEKNEKSLWLDGYNFVANTMYLNNASHDASAFPSLASLAVPAMSEGAGKLSYVYLVPKVDEYSISFDSFDLRYDYKLAKATTSATQFTNPNVHITDVAISNVELYAWDISGQYFTKWLENSAEQPKSASTTTVFNESTHNLKNITIDKSSTVAASSRVLWRIGSTVNEDAKGHLTGTNSGGSLRLLAELSNFNTNSNIWITVDTKNTPTTTLESKGANGTQAAAFLDTARESAKLTFDNITNNIPSNIDAKLTGRFYQAILQAKDSAALLGILTDYYHLRILNSSSKKETDIESAKAVSPSLSTKSTILNYYDPKQANSTSYDPPLSETAYSKLLQKIVSIGDLSTLNELINSVDTLDSSEEDTKEADITKAEPVTPVPADNTPTETNPTEENKEAASTTEGKEKADTTTDPISELSLDELLAQIQQESAAFTKKDGRYEEIYDASKKIQQLIAQMEKIDPEDARTQQARLILVKLPLEVSIRVTDQTILLNQFNVPVTRLVIGILYQLSKEKIADMKKYDTTEELRKHIGEAEAALAEYNNVHMYLHDYQARLWVRSDSFSYEKQPDDILNEVKELVSNTEKEKDSCNNDQCRAVLTKTHNLGLEIDRYVQIMRVSQAPISYQNKMRLIDEINAAASFESIEEVTEKNLSAYAIDKMNAEDVITSVFFLEDELRNKYMEALNPSEEGLTKEEMEEKLTESVKTIVRDILDNATMDVALRARLKAEALSANDVSTIINILPKEFLADNADAYEQPEPTKTSEEKAPAEDTTTQTTTKSVEEPSTPPQPLNNGTENGTTKSWWKILCLALGITGLVGFIATFFNNWFMT